MSEGHLLATLQATLAGLKAQRNRLERLIEAFETVIAHYTEQPEPLVDPADRKALRNELWRVLDAEGHPMHYRDLYQRVSAAGIVVHGQEPVRNVGAHLSGDGRFRSLGGGMWGLHSWDGRVAKTEVPA